MYQCSQQLKFHELATFITKACSVVHYCLFSLLGNVQCTHNDSAACRCTLLHVPEHIAVSNVTRVGGLDQVH